MSRRILESSKGLLFTCKCGKIKRFSEWIDVTPKIVAGLMDATSRIDFKQEVCPTCQSMNGG